MANFTFHNPTKIIFGRGTISEIGPQIKGRGLKRPLLIAGGGSIKKNTVYEQVCRSLKEAGLEFCEIWGVQPNPVLEKVNEAIKLAKKEKADSILAVGGGSVIDTAKAAAAGFYLDDVWNAFKDSSLIKTALPLFTVLTISATGSEMNPNAVVTRDKDKWAIISRALYPKVSIVDPSVQMSLPWKQTAYGAVDALAHIMESYFCGRDEETALDLDEALMRSIIKGTDTLKNDEKNYEARESLAWAATLALNGMSACLFKAGDWSSHKIEHGISGYFPEVSHGQGLAIVFPAWIIHCWKENPHTFKRWAKNVWGAESVEEAVEKMMSKFSSWKLAINLTELGIKEESLEIISNTIMSRGAFGQVKRLCLDDVMKILKAAY